MSSPLTLVEKVGRLERRDDDAGLTIHFEAEGEERAISFPGSVVAQLIAGLLGNPKPTSGRPLAAAPVKATGAWMYGDTSTPFGDRAGLAFELPGAWVLHFAIPEQAVPALRKAVEDIGLFYKAQGTRQ